MSTSSGNVLLCAAESIALPLRTVALRVFLCVAIACIHHAACSMMFVFLHHGDVGLGIDTPMCVSVASLANDWLMCFECQLGLLAVVRDLPSFHTPKSSKALRSSCVIRCSVAVVFIG
jgi:hypothetical protein